MAAKQKGSQNLSPRIENRRAWHEYHINAKLECGLVLVGSEVKSLRLGKATLQDSFARVEAGELFLFGLHIDPYIKASLAMNHAPLRTRKLLVHKRELRRLANETSERGVTLIPLAIYFKNGIAKVELAVARGKQTHDKRQAIKERERDRELRRATMHRG
jgi:SsrA-binding protein